jgi:hypothetical protein
MFFLPAGQSLHKKQLRLNQSDKRYSPAQPFLEALGLQT